MKNLLISILTITIILFIADNIYIYIMTYR